MVLEEFLKEFPSLKKDKKKISCFNGKSQHSTEVFHWKPFPQDFKNSPLNFYIHVYQSHNSKRKCPGSFQAHCDVICRDNELCISHSTMSDTKNLWSQCRGIPETHSWDTQGSATVLFSHPWHKVLRIFECFPYAKDAKDKL